MATEVIDANGDVGHTTNGQPVRELEQELTVDNVELIFGLPLEKVYKLAMKFYKNNEKSGQLQVEYPVRLRFMAYNKQVRLGPFKSDLADVGWFDLVGNDAK
ncbi:ACB domain-containing protein [Aphelenchoides fujianensis]|nr:ACB domain-containing protein [Aphelenchoides fujianensis]